MNKFCLPFQQSSDLKLLGFEEPTPHCFVHLQGEEYGLELFTFLLGGEGTMSEVYEDEKKERNFRIEIDGVTNESDIYFNYNQDIRKLVARIYNGEEYMNDEKSFNMNIDSYTFEKWTPEEHDQKKISLPNYNDGDFEFTVYQDVISAPTYSQAFKHFRDKYGYDISIKKSTPSEYKFVIEKVAVKGDDYYFIDFPYSSYEHAELACINKLIEIIKRKKN